MSSLKTSQIISECICKFHDSHILYSYLYLITFLSQDNIYASCIFYLHIQCFYKELEVRLALFLISLNILDTFLLQRVLLPATLIGFQITMGPIPQSTFSHSILKPHFDSCVLNKYLPVTNILLLAGFLYPLLLQGKYPVSQDTSSLSLL